MSAWQPVAFTGLLVQFVADQIACLGVQASVAHGGTVHELCFASVGPDQSCTVDTVRQLFSATKPGGTVLRTEVSGFLAAIEGSVSGVVQPTAVGARRS